MVFLCLLSLGLVQGSMSLPAPQLRLGLACDPKNTQCDQPSLGRQVTRKHFLVKFNWSIVFLFLLSEGVGVLIFGANAIF